MAAPARRCSNCNDKEQNHSRSGAETWGRWSELTPALATCWQQRGTRRTGIHHATLSITHLAILTASRGSPRVCAVGQRRLRTGLAVPMCVCPAAASSTRSRQRVGVTTRSLIAFLQSSLRAPAAPPPASLAGAADAAQALTLCRFVCPFLLLLPFTDHVTSPINTNVVVVWRGNKSKLLAGAVNIRSARVSERHSLECAAG